MSNDQPDHSISLESVWFVRSVVSAISEHNPDATTAPVAANNRIHVEPIADQPGRYHANMRSTINEEMSPAAPYFIDMECIATLTADATLSPEEAKRGVSITAHSVLYGAIREAVAWLTGRQPHGQMMLGLSVLRPKQADE